MQDASVADPQLQLLQSFQQGLFITLGGSWIGQQKPVGFAIYKVIDQQLEFLIAVINFGCGV